MRWISTLALRLRSLFRRSRVEDELDEELRFYLDQQTQAFVAQGLPPAEARFAALRAMGGIDQRKEACRDARRVSWIENVGRDMRHAAAQRAARVDPMVALRCE